MIEGLKNPEEMDALVRAVWKESEGEIVKRVEWAISEQFRQHAHSRASVLVRAEVDAILKPKLASMREEMERRAQKVAGSVLPRLEEVLKSGLEEALRSVADDTVRSILGEAQRRVHAAMVNVLARATTEIKSLE